MKNVGLFAAMGLALVAVGMFQSWNVALAILNLSLISAVMALGVNIQWGYAGIFNVGIMGFAALGGVAAVLVSMPPTGEAWSAGGARVLAGLALGAGILCLSLTARSLDLGHCEDFPLGTHFLWHILNAVMLGWMIEVWLRHRAGRT